MAHDADAEFVGFQAALAGEYSLDRELGRGGMGVVYLAREVRLARPVAIKVLPPALAARADLRAAFLREAQTAAGLTHPNIVPVYAAGERNGFVYIVMAFVDGTTLGERIRARGPLLPGEAARVLREVAWALAYAHGTGIVHRDVSAENIMLERGSERAIVTDFGIAGAMRASARDLDGRVMGNAHYVSPEQAAGEPLDARSDLYSLGVAGYYALTGRLPFDGATAAEVVNRHLTALPPTITSVAPTVPPRLAGAVERCLHKDPIRRYRNAESFAEAIDLAFEHAREIPAPLRSWIAQGERELPARFALLGIGSIVGVSAVLATGRTAVFFAPVFVLSVLSVVPWLSRLRRTLAEGYTTDDLHASLREHQLVRAEEIEYERRQASPRFKRVMRVIFGVSAGMSVVGAAMLVETIRFVDIRRVPWEMVRDSQMVAYAVLFPALNWLAISGVPLAGEFFRFRLANRLTSASISFWKGRWGTRLAKLASLGLAKVSRPALGMPLLTEVALGRATDHLFEALPRAARRELSGLPDIVRRLEADAGKLRRTVDALDDQLAAFDRGDDGPDASARQPVADELRAARALAAERLATTVAAIENIRLDLLRLQMGSTGIESVTASLDAARHIGRQINDSLDAQREVERLLRSSASGPILLPDAAMGEDDDADTPVTGVPATRG